MSFDDTNPLTAAYPGNPALPKEVREKVLTTFRHTLSLYREGKTDDCHIGCDFILKMDPRFAPARQLMEKVKNPAADVDLDRLEAVLKSAPAPQARPSSPDVDRLLVRAAESLAARDFDAAMAAAQQILTSLPNNRQAQELMEQARSKREGQGTIERARQKAIEALETGRVADARRQLQQMKAIDADHPSVALLERRIVGAGPEQTPTSTMDFSSPAGLESALASGGSGEPAIEFGITEPEPPSRTPAGAAAGGLDGLSLDSLSLDGPDTRVVPPAGSRRASPLDAAPGSPADMWGAGPELAEEPAPVLDAPAFPSGPPPSPIFEPEPESGGGGSDPEIASLLRQGDEAAERGDRQQAIEIWSRIFLMDINNSEAVERIERARQDMAEGNRVVSDGLKAGRDAFEAGEFAVARERFLKVLAVDENEPTARFYIDRIEEEMHRKTAEPASADAPAARSTSEPGPAAAAKPAPRAKTKRSLKMPAVPKKALALVAVFLVVLAGAAFFVLRAPKNAGAGSGAAGAGGSAAPAEATFERALALLKEGKEAEALGELQRIPVESPDHDAAQKMIGSIRAGQAPGGGPGAAVVEGGPGTAGPGGDPVPARLRAAAEQALSEKRYIDALRDFHAAAPAFGSDPSFTQSMGTASEKVGELTPAVKLYNEGEYETAIPILWRIFQAERDNADAKSYLQRAYYNLGVSQLQSGLFPRAIETFNEVMDLDPQDIQASRHKKFAERYLKADLDLMGRIYVRHIQPRP